MELTKDLTCVQDIVTSLNKNIGPLEKINYIGGNEDKLMQIKTEVLTYLKSKNYITNDDKINEANQAIIENIVTFLVLNTSFKNSHCLKAKEYDHLINIMPSISKCILTYCLNELGLIEVYARIIDKLPIEMTHELMEDEINACKFMAPTKTLYVCFNLSQCAIKKITNVDMTDIKVREAVDQINTVICELLKLSIRFNPDTIQGIKKSELYEHFAHTFNNYLELLQMCDENNPAHAKIFDHLIRHAATIVKEITVDVFCHWSEVTYNGQPLQLYVAENAFHIVERFGNYKGAKELITLLKPFARKPRTITQKIAAASREVIIAEVAKNDQYQKLWFRALISIDIFRSQASMDCLSKHVHLCNIDDVNVILKYCMNHTTVESKQLAIKCASVLSADDLSILLSRFFYEFGLNSHLEYHDVQSELVIKLNKINLAKEMQLSLHELDNTEIKELQLLFLQNPKFVLSILFNECVKNMVYTFWLCYLFKSLKYVISIEDIALTTLAVTFETKNIAEDNNYAGFMHLIKMLIDVEACDCHDIVNAILIPALKKYCMSDDCNIKYVINLFKEMPLNSLPQNVSSDLVRLFLEVLHKFRCKFTEFSMTKMEIVMATTDLLLSLPCSDDEAKFQIVRYLSSINKYYALAEKPDFLLFIYPNIQTDRFARNVTNFISLLTRCTPNEWICVVKSLLNLKYTSQKILEMLTDTLILICQTVASQDVHSNLPSFNALKFYIHAYGLMVKFLQQNGSNAFEVDFIRNACRLIKAMPLHIQHSEGLNLITLFSDEALKFLVTDRQFVLLLASIKDVQIKQVVSQKMLKDL